MGTHIGNEGQVKLGNNAVGEVTGFQLTESAAVADDSALGDAWDTHLVGSKSWSGQIDCHWDDADTQGQDVLAIGASIALINFYVEGSSSGDKYYNGAATVTQITRQVSRNQTVSASFQVQGNGALSISTVPA